MKKFLLSLFLLCVSVVFSTSEVHAANYNCLVTSSQDATQNLKPGTLRYYLERTMSLPSGYANCPPPAQAGDAKVDEFEQVVVFNTKEFTGTPKEVLSIQLIQPLDISQSENNVVVGNWAPEMLVDSEADITYPLDYVTSEIGNYGTVFLDARSHLSEDESPFKCEGKNIYLRNMVIWSHQSWSEIQESSPCVKSAGAVYVCDGTAIVKNPIASSLDAVPSGYSSSVIVDGDGGALQTGEGRVKSSIDSLKEDNRVGSKKGKSGKTTLGRRENSTTWCRGGSEDTTKELICSDGQDNDDDGKIDCEDSDCADSDACNGNSRDNDGDGFTENGGDCNDSNADINPSVEEICDDQVDNDCDGLVDECASDTQDDDDDGYAESDGDCNDQDPYTHPNAEEKCGDSVDNNCDGVLDENCNSDDDGDGHSENDGDCDDSNAEIYPGAVEACDGIDNNCDQVVDEGLATNTFYADEDADTYGDANVTMTACAAPQGYVSNSLDCLDTDAMVNPEANEVCGDGVDNNCDGNLDEGECTDPSTETLCTDEQDNDSDGSVDCDDADCSATSACVDADDDGYTVADGDCDDNNAAIYPGATDLSADGIDNNCDGINPSIGDDVDNDGDGYTEMAGDCDDSDETVNPEAQEICDDGIDNNCDNVEIGSDDLGSSGQTVTGLTCAISVVPTFGGQLQGSGCACNLSAAEIPLAQGFLQSLLAIFPAGMMLWLRRRTNRRS